MRFEVERSNRAPEYSSRQFTTTSMALPMLFIEHPQHGLRRLAGGILPEQVMKFMEARHLTALARGIAQQIEKRRRERGRRRPILDQLRHQELAGEDVGKAD